MLRVKRLHPDAKLPEVAHPGDDLGFDVYALKDTVLPFGKAVAVETGIVVAVAPYGAMRKYGLIVKDRSSMAAKGIHTSAGVIDAGYRGELKIMMINHSGDHYYEAAPYSDGSSRGFRLGYLIKAGDKIAQIIPTEVFTAEGVLEVGDLGETTRGTGGFGSTGK